MEVWSGMDGADSRPGGRVWEKVMWKWNAAELDARQRPLQSRRERLLKNSKTKWKPCATWERLPRPCFAVVPITQNNLVCDIISPPGRVVLLFIYLSILDVVSIRHKNSTHVMRGDPAPREPRQRWTNNYSAITARLSEIGEGMHHSASSWRRELTQQATCKTGKEFAARESAAGRQRWN